MLKNDTYIPLILQDLASQISGFVCAHVVYLRSADSPLI